jgi:uncharacterized membrane protein (DUF485 family)
VTVIAFLDERFVLSLSAKPDHGQGRDVQGGTVTATDRPSPPEPYDPSGGAGGQDWEEIAASPDFQELRHRLRSFVFPMTGLFLAWYLLYVLLASYAPSFMAIKLVGNINVGLVFGLLQFVSTFAITFLYVRFADRRLDPLAAQLRRDIEGPDIEGPDTEGRDTESRDIEEGVK